MSICKIIANYSNYSKMWTLKDDIQTSKVVNSSLYKLIMAVKQGCFNCCNSNFALQ